jgi:hypothetical protein
MLSLWQRFTLSDLSLTGWVDASYVYRWVGSLQSWRQRSWLMQWGDEIGAILTALVFVLSPFESSLSTDLIGFLMIAVAALHRFTSPYLLFGRSRQYRRDYPQRERRRLEGWAN